jgi:DHA1 family bicyclomycin/chloramphenicol resistance-like MFS transporter
MGVTFAYVAISAFVLQSINGLSPMTYSIDFAANAVGLAVATLVAARLAGRVPTRVVIFIGLCGTAAAGVLLLIGAVLFGMPLVVALIGFFVLMTSQGLVGPNAGALASAEVPGHPGTGSAVLGFLQWCAAGVVAPIAGLGGETTAVPMACIVLVLVAVSFVAFLTPMGLTKTCQRTSVCGRDPVPFLAVRIIDRLPGMCACASVTRPCCSR